MQYQLICLYFGSMLAALSVASPTSNLQPRDKLKVQITFSDQTVPLGTAPVNTVFDAFAKTCATSGLCNTSPVDITGYSLWSQGRNPSSNTGITITIVPGGVYPTWVHNGLLDGLKAAVQKAAVCKDVTYTYPSDVDRHSNSSPRTVNQCTIPQFVGITWQSGDAIYFMEFASKTTPNADGFCSTFTTLSGAVAGAVNGAAGGIFAFLGLACGSSAKV
ncbi:hypothetical protein HYFRA_00013769 [Hymenoscyphus fraxineus]|uniref:Uncharacterized protein n=1 Tax=Hymenoscyphus fraxineus TaxID=746836 RepID=A0A9N9LB21_9HELO|nr:hypothetical protein HYFRA_00013769 [Hymenoscyphus fraxineus]